MNVLSIISLSCFIIVMLIGLLFAGMYLFRKEFMPYHSAAVGKSWSELDLEIRVLIIALMRVVGGGWLASSVAMGSFLYLLFLKGILHMGIARFEIDVEQCVDSAQGGVRAMVGVLDAEDLLDRTHHEP